eukprot:NODE_3570_length_951_cov_165.924612_g3280_i0.p1 GENE.NODE_3570_length_951_cov_165.924612_g3280_i0~~NODE_3570_length_951_cov_165.924612_g3280_i0.p1  ORF type:complete len:250 (+),score=71.94 NODE_3570_length_951_cov_165.924612_g3280_i0:62-751(+)
MTTEAKTTFQQQQAKALDDRIEQLEKEYSRLREESRQIDDKLKLVPRTKMTAEGQEDLIARLYSDAVEKKKQNEEKRRSGNQTQSTVLSVEEEEELVNRLFYEEAERKKQKDEDRAATLLEMNRVQSQLQELDHDELDNFVSRMHDQETLRRKTKKEELAAKYSMPAKTAKLGPSAVKSSVDRIYFQSKAKLEEKRKHLADVHLAKPVPCRKLSPNEVHMVADRLAGKS